MAKTTDLLSGLQNRINAGGALSVAELRDATWQAVRFVVFSVASGEADQLGTVSGGITQVTEAYFDQADGAEELPREWARSLAVVGQIAVALYESMGPSVEARKILGRSQHARKVAQILLSKGTVQAKELRELAEIQHQPTLARIIHALAKARIVAVQQGPGNTAWYRLTPEGSRLLRSAVLEPSDMSIPVRFEHIPQPEPATLEPVVQLAQELTKKLEDLHSDSRSKAPEKATVSKQREESHVAAR